jgi:hypothetical protein
LVKKYTIINFTYWSERGNEVKLSLGRGKYNFLDSVSQKKEGLKKIRTFMSKY